MLHNLQRLLTAADLFAWIGVEHRQATALALKAESRVRQLNGLPANPIEGDLVSILESTCLLLKRLEKPVPPKSDSNNRVDQANEVESDSTQTPDLPNTVREVIKLRDWVLLAKKSQPEEDIEVLSAIYYELGQILQREGVSSIEETGMFDCQRHQIVATQITGNPQQGDRICDTVRPGYLFNNELIRPQEAIVYVFQPAEN